MTSILGILLSAGICTAQSMLFKLIDYVDPLIGTAPSSTVSAIAHGEGTELLANTNPAIGVPHGMTHFPLKRVHPSGNAYRHTIMRIQFCRVLGLGDG